MNEDQIVDLVAREVLVRIRSQRGGHQSLPVNVSARHIHLSKHDLEALFGPGFALSKLKDLRQPGQFAASETVGVIGPRGGFPRVRVLGPTRGDTQLEISLSDARALGLDVPVRLSGQIDGTPGITLTGPKGQIKIPKGLIVAARHIHLGTQDAAVMGLRPGQKVRIRTAGDRPLTFDDVIVRVDARFVPEMHVDTDEANAAGIRDGDIVTIMD